MSIPVAKTSFILGEVAPTLFGHVDLARMQAAASTFRNGFVKVQGGYYSRAGTKFVGYSKQTGRAFPPRMVPFQFSIQQGLALEFGNFYMRVISNGGYVTDRLAVITAASQTNPATLGLSATGFAAASATPNIGAVTNSYAPGDSVMLAGGLFTTASVLAITNTQLANLGSNALGSGYVPGDTITLAGGTASPRAVLSLTNTQIASAVINNVGSGPAGTFIATGTTGTGTKFQLSMTRGFSGLILNGITLGGAYTVNPTNLAAEPVTGGGQSGITITITMGVGAFTFSNRGTFTVNAPGGTFTQFSTSGAGTGATFGSGIFAPRTLTVQTAGVYSVYPSNPVSQAATSGTGAGATFTVTTTTVAISAFNVGDWIAISGVGGMTQLNGNTYVVATAPAGSVTLNDVYGNPVDATGFSAYTSGGTAQRIYTLATPYAEADLGYLKWTQSADVMSLCCVNQQTLTEYPPQDLTRSSNNSWSFSAVVPAPSVTPPTSASGVASSAGSVNYGYVITSVNGADGTESVASPVASINNAVNIAGTAGSITLTWAAVLGVNEYNVYKATPGVGVSPPVGALFGFIGHAFGTQFIDSNIIADFAQVPPTHVNPFARGQILSARVTGSSGTVTSVTFTITTSTGSGAVLQGMIVNSVLVAIIVVDPGQNYAASDTVAVNVTGGGSATANLIVGPQSGTYPSVPAYFQDRRAYANTLNQPDTYFMSQPGAFTNFDSRIPTIPSDAIIGSPWSVQVNGIQWMTTTIGGLLVFTGQSAWLLVGAGSFATNVSPISPESQLVTPQPHTGASPTVAPFKVDFDVIYLNTNNNVYLDLPYQLYTLSTPIDLTENSPHLFLNYQVVQHAWCEIPFKTLWSVRSDGTMLVLTYYKPQQVAGWGRADTNGLFQSVCPVREPPIDALYLAVQRFPTAGAAYMIERMDNRQWTAAENCWCVDCGLSLPQFAPQVTLTASSATGLGACSGVTGLVGGSGYSSGTTASVVDAPTQPGAGVGPGTGAVPSLTIVGGVVTAVAFTGGNKGSGYLNPVLIITDPAGSAGGGGASASVTLDNSATFTSSVAGWDNSYIGQVIRMGGGIAVIASITDTFRAVANILSPIVRLIGSSPAPAAPGTWTLTVPVTSVGGLQYLAGMTVTGLADGNVIPPTVVPASGIINLPAVASPNVTGYTAVIVGLAFTPQLQSVYLDAGQPTIQGQRKKIAAVTARIESSRGLKAGSNMPDGSTQNPIQVAPAWYEGVGGLASIPDTGQGTANFPPVLPNSLCTPLRTGDVRVTLTGGFATPGQVAFQQDNPLPMQILSIAVEEAPGDTPQTTWPKKEQQRQRAA